MRCVLILFFAFVSTRIFAFDYEKPLPNVSMLNNGVSVNTQIPKVNPASGEYFEEECDLSIAGCCPLNVTRFYESMNRKSMLYAYWRFNPETYVKANFEKDGFPQNVQIGDREGGTVLLDGRREAERSYIFEIQKHKSFVNTSKGYPSGQSNPKNFRITYNKRIDPKNTDRCSFYGEIIDGSGRRCEFESAMHQYHKKIKRKDAEYGPEWWTPYYLGLTTERLPNGNLIKYTYSKFCDDSIFPTHYRVKSIEAFNRTGTRSLGKLSYSYPSHKNGLPSEMIVTGSDGRQVISKTSLRSIYKAVVSLKDSIRGRIGDVGGFDHQIPLLQKSIRLGQPEVEYTYDDDLRITEVRHPENRILRTSYDQKGRVKEQQVCAERDKFFCIARFEYEDHVTSLYDGEDNLTRFKYDQHRRLVATEKYQGRILYSVERNIWDDESQLIAQTIEDATGHIHKKIEFDYDRKGNVIKERAFGAGSPEQVVLRSYSDDGFNLKVFENDGDTFKRFSYLPGTNLCTEETTYVGNNLKKKISRRFDDAGVCIEEREEDAEKKYVKIHRVKPREDRIITKEEACSGLTNFQKKNRGELAKALQKAKDTYFGVGLPEVVEELTLDDVGKEVLLKKVVYSYTRFGKVSKEDHYDSTNALKYSLVNDYDERERLKTHIDAMGNKIEYYYDANNNLIEEIGPRSDQIKRVTYDLLNRPIKIAEMKNDGTWLTVQKEYDRCGRVKSTQDPSGFKTIYEYDSLGRLIKVIHPDGSCEIKGYDLFGNITREVDPCGNEKKTKYDYRNLPIEIEHPDGSREKLFYNSNGTLKEHHDRNGAIVCYEYDAFKRPISTKVYSAKGALLKSTSAKYSTYNLESITDGLGLVTKYTYDRAGRKTGEEVAGKKTFFEYDTLGRLCKSRLADIVSVEVFDHCNRLIEKRVEGIRGEVVSFENYSYDAAGNKIRVKRGKGETQIEYNAQGLPTLRIDPCGNRTQYSYSYLGGFKSWETNAKGVTSIVSHDERGREKSFVIEDASVGIIQKIMKSYDASGNLKLEEHHVFEGNKFIRKYVNEWRYGRGNLLATLIEGGTKVTSYQYDGCGRLAAIKRPNNDVLSHEYDEFGKLKRFYSKDFDYQYTYDANGRVKRVKDHISGRETIREYDDLGNVVQDFLSNGLVVENAYDEIGRRRRVNLPDGSEIKYEYLGEKLSKIQRGNYLARYVSRDVYGLVKEMELPGGLGVKYERDANGRMWMIGSRPYHAQMRYDGVGNLDYFSTVIDNVSNEKYYEYDSLNQLIGEEGVKYRYDSLNNRVAKGNYSYVVNGLNQVESDGESRYRYDLNGNMIEDGSYKYTYDSQDRLIRVVGKGKDIGYEYDSFHRRVLKRVNGVEERYIWDGENEIGKVEGGKIIELRVLGEGLGAEIGAAVLMEIDGRSYVPLHDYRGCLIYLRDLGSGVEERYDYSGYGERKSGGCKSPWCFSSKRLDEEMGFIYFGRRYYDPDLGRWVTPDPLGFRDGPNLYAYVHNSPLTHLDLYGLAAIFNPSNLFFNSPNFLAVGQYYPSFEKQHKVRSSNFSLKTSAREFGEGFLKNNFNDLKIGKITYVNGILNTKLNAADGALSLSSFSKSNIHVTHNASNGFATDSFESVLNFMGVRTPPVMLLMENWNDHFSKFPNIPLLHFCHSQGAIITSVALKNYPKELREKIIVIAIAPAKYIDPKLCKSVTHYVSRGDPVTSIDQYGMERYSQSIRYLDRHPKAETFFGHEFNCPTYDKAKEQQIKKYIRSLNEYY